MFETIILLLFYLFGSFLSDVILPSENLDYIEFNKPEMVITSNFIDVDDLINGDIPLFTDFYLPAVEDRDNKTKRRQSDDFMMTRDELPVLIAADYDQISGQNSSYDILEFNKLNPIVNNLTRRYKGWFHGYSDPDDRPKDYEAEKLLRMLNIAKQFLLHSRYIVRMVIAQKEQFRLSTRYKIGYLFNRLRRIRYEQLKIVNLAENQRNTEKWQNLTSLLRFYEKVVRMDIDVKDTINWIKSMHESELMKDPVMAKRLKAFQNQK